MHHENPSARYRAFDNLPSGKLKHLVIYRSASDALAAGFAPREAGRKARAV